MNGQGELSLDDVLTNNRIIESILQFWFGQYSPDWSQKHLWMISASSQDHLQRVDETISTQFYPHLQAIFHNTNHMRDQWCTHTDWYSWRGKLASIILLDQFSRHIRRHGLTQGVYHSSQSEVHIELPHQSLFDTLAYSIAQSFQLQHKQEISSGMIPLPMYIFSLMPYRHASTLEDVAFVLQKVEELANLHHQDMENMIRRFRRASNRRMAGLQDEARRTGSHTRFNLLERSDVDTATSVSPTLERSASNGTVSNTSSSWNCLSDLEPDPSQHFQPDSKSDTQFQEDDILETLPFDADLSNAGEHIVVQTLVEFLNARDIVPQTHSIQGPSVIPIIISLSGGVDSMVIASALTFLRDHKQFPHLHIVAVHIDYGNRPESPAEAAYVYRYAMERLKLQDCIIQQVGQYKRGITARDEYEKATRNIRFDLYKDTIQSCREYLSSISAPQVPTIGVMLGHHQGDVRENVLSNAHKGCGPLDLSGMTTMSMNDGVCIYRPLLRLEKSCILDYAHTFGVPYFKDTTPHWSTRGKLRNKLIPLLEEIYGDGSMMNLTHLARESDEARLLLNEKVLRPFMEKVTYYPMGIIFHTKPFLDQGFYFWKLALRDVLHSAKRGMFGDKLIAAFLNRVKRETITPGWLQCRPDYSVYLQEDGRVCIFHPESFPPGEGDIKGKFVGQVIPYGEENALEIGPWRVCCKVVHDGDNEKLKQKAVNSWDEFMKGHLEYYLTVPGSKELQVIPHFRKQNRPSAWKGVDLKIEKTLPILGLADGGVGNRPTDGVISVVTIDLIVQR